MKRPLLLALALAAPSALALPLGPGVPVKRVIPPPVIISGVSKMTVSISGVNGPALTTELVSALQSKDRVTKGVDGTAMAKAAVDGVSQMGAAYAQALVPMGGKLAGGLVKTAGDMAEDSIEDHRILLNDGLRIDVFEIVKTNGQAGLAGASSVEEKTENYTQKVAAKDDKGNEIKDANGKTVMVEEACFRRTVTASVPWAVTSNKGQKLAGETFSGKSSSAGCGADIKKVAKKEDLIPGALAGFGLQIANTIAPVYELLRLDMDREKSIAEEIKLARKGQTFLAICGMRQVLKSRPEHNEALYGLGALHEGMGWYDEALAYYGKASGNNRGAAKSIERVNARKGQIDTLATAYGTRFTVPAPDYATCPKVPDGREVYTKKDLDLTDAPGGNARMTLEKGMKLYVVEEGADFTKVQTVDGTQGFLPTKALK
jgi:hypothetical protein